MLEIALIIWAWHRGWKGWALLPSSVVFFVVLVTGADLMTVILLELAAIATLVVMVRSPRRSAAAPRGPVQKGDGNLPATPETLTEYSSAHP